MDLRIFTEPRQGAAHADLLRVAQAAEVLGFDGFFCSDHYPAMGGDGLPGPVDSWTTLSAPAVQTERIALGGWKRAELAEPRGRVGKATLVTSATSRLPGPLAVAVAQADQTSGGRIELGLGAGWFAAEHTGHGIPFPSTGQRFARLVEQLAIITGCGRRRSVGRTRSPARPTRWSTRRRGPSPGQVVDALGRRPEKAGVTRVDLQVLDLADLDHVELVAAGIAPQPA